MSAERRAQVMYYCAPRRTWERNRTDPRGMDAWLAQVAGFRSYWNDPATRRARWMGL